MRCPKPVLALIAVLITAMSVPVFARGHSGGGHSGGGHSGGGRSHGGHASSGARAPVHAAPSRHIASIAGIGMFASIPFYEPLFNPGPGYYYSPPPSSYSPPPGSPPVIYIEKAPDPAYWYFCPQSNTYYPYVLECSEAWTLVLPPPSE